MNHIAGLMSPGHSVKDNYKMLDTPSCHCYIETHFTAQFYVKFTEAWNIYSEKQLKDIKILFTL